MNPIANCLNRHRSASLYADHFNKMSLSSHAVQRLIFRRKKINLRERRNKFGVHIICLNMFPGFIYVVMYMLKSGKLKQNIITMICV